MKKFLNNVRDIPVAGFLALLRSTYTDSSALIQWQEILAAGVDSLKALSKYDRQCVDCHNRSTHTFYLPDRAMDKALALGDIAVTLPYIKKKGVELLKASYNSSQEAADKLPRELVAFYQQNYPDLYAKRSQDINQAGQAILAIYNRNVFPDMRVTWGTYPQ